MYLKYGVFPDEWKNAYIVPIFKGGDKFNYCNYRPISILNCCTKVFENIIRQRLSFHVQNFIHTSQHGFIKGRSILTNLVQITDIIANSINKNEQVDVIYFDLSAAFDMVDHRILLRKLSNMGLSPNLLLSFQSIKQNFYC